MLRPPVSIHVTREGVRIPTLAWVPEAARATVLIGHGGGGHKGAASVRLLVEALVARGFACVAIDGPVHGERRADANLDPDVAKESFRLAWREGVGRESMAHDFSAALDALHATIGLSSLPVGYLGFSMGTAYGIPLVAMEPRIGAAALGLWGASYPASEHLVAYARRIRCPVCFIQQWDDELFDRAGTHALFDAIGSTHKKLVAYPGGHRQPDGDRLDEAVRFLADALAIG
jgi:alpha-beta hydrolase superfamily lysophospholipase